MRLNCTDAASGIVTQQVCIKLVIVEVYTKIRGQQNIKKKIRI